MLKHKDIWAAIDRLAAQNGLSTSGLALKAGLDSTSFNLSKREKAGRLRWPSTESISRVLQATRTTTADFLALTAPASAPANLPLLGYAQAGRAGYFDDAGYPAGKGWDEIRFPGLDDPHAFALEVNGKSMLPLYREGDRLILSPAAKPRKGDRVVVRTTKGEVMVKELGKMSAKQIELKSFNADFAPVTLPAEEIAWVYCILWVSQSV